MKRVSTQVLLRPKAKYDKYRAGWSSDPHEGILYVLPDELLKEITVEYHCYGEVEESDEV